MYGCPLKIVLVNMYILRLDQTLGTAIVIEPVLDQLVSMKTSGRLLSLVHETNVTPSTMCDVLVDYKPSSCR
jgi:hypothetical protein